MSWLTPDSKFLSALTPDQTKELVTGSRADWLASVLRKRILNGDYGPGDRIREASLQEEFGLSNGPIREALQQIVADGIAERAPWRGVRVVELTTQQLRELFQIRLALMEYAAELAAQAQYDDKEKHAEELKLELSKRFQQVQHKSPMHPSFGGSLSRWLMATAGNQLLREMWQSTMLRTLPFVNASIHKTSGEVVHNLIIRLIDAVVAGDVPAARQAARDLSKQNFRDLNIDGEL